MKYTFKIPLSFLAFAIFIFSTNLVLSTTNYQGIDVSHYQGDIDFDKVLSSGYNAVYIKSGEGSSYVDPMFTTNYKNASEAGLYYGFYYYVTATTTTEAKSQANTFANLISGMDYTLRPTMDFEVFDGITIAKSNLIARTFLEELENLTGIIPVIYSDAYNVETRWDDTLSKYPLWIAAYEDLDNPANYSIPTNNIWDTWSGYQYADSLNISGITTNVDANLFTSKLFVNETIISGSSSNTQYTIKKGDTLWQLSNTYDVSISTLVSLNNIENKDLIYVGEILTIPNQSYTPYTIKYDDTLSEIAKNYNTSVNEIALINSIENVDLIYAGDILKIP